MEDHARKDNLLDLVKYWVYTLRHLGRQNGNPGLAALLQCFDVPEAYWKTVRTTNVNERAFRHVQRRTRPISGICSCDSCDRIVYGVMSYIKRSWERKPLPEFTQDL